MLERPAFVPQKLGMKLLEMGKDMKIKHSISILLEYKGSFFLEKALHERTNFFRKNFFFGRGGCFTWGLMVRSCKGGRKVSRMHFSII